MSESNNASQDVPADAKAPTATSASPERSSYYFFESTPADKAKEFAPQRVEAPAPTQSQADGKSAWNNGNTW